MGSHGSDCQLSPFAQRLFPYDIECKNQETLNIWRAIDQSCSNSSTSSTPCVVFRKNRTAAWGAVPWDHLMSLIRRAHGRVDPVMIGGAVAVQPVANVTEAVVSSPSHAGSSVAKRKRDALAERLTNIQNSLHTLTQEAATAFGMLTQLDCDPAS